MSGPRVEHVISRRAENTGQSVEAMRAGMLSGISLRRMISAEDVAATIGFLLSDAGANLSGQSLAVDGSVEVL